MDRAVSTSSSPAPPGRRAAAHECLPGSPSPAAASDARQQRCDDLLRAAGLGDRASFRDLYAQSSAHLFAVVRRTIWQRAEAEEVLQEIYLKIWRHASVFDARQSHALTWMSRIARNHSIDHLRRQAARPTTASQPVPSDGTEPEDAVMVDAAPRPDEWLEITQQQRRLTRLLERLSGIQRQVLLMAFCEGRSQSDIALQLGAPLGSVKSWMRRALQQLKLEIDHAEQEHHGRNA